MSKRYYIGLGLILVAGAIVEPFNLRNFASCALAYAGGAVIWHEFWREFGWDNGDWDDDE